VASPNAPIQWPYSPFSMAISAAWARSTAHSRRSPSASRNRTFTAHPCTRLVSGRHACAQVHDVRGVPPYLGFRKHALLLLLRRRAARGRCRRLHVDVRHFRTVSKIRTTTVTHPYHGRPDLTQYSSSDVQKLCDGRIACQSMYGPAAAAGRGCSGTHTHTGASSAPAEPLPRRSRSSPCSSAVRLAVSVAAVVSVR
jgi:hypothetical protein